MNMMSLLSHTFHTLQSLDVAYSKPFKTTFKAYKNKWMIKNNGGKVEKETLAHWVDLSLTRLLSKSNITVAFKAIRIWPLNLEKIQQKMGSSKTIYSIPLEKLIEYEIIKDDLPKGEKNARHFYIEEEVGSGLEVGAKLENAIEIGQFLKLPQRMVQAPRFAHEPLIDYLQNQILTSKHHIQSMEDIAHQKRYGCTRKDEKS